MWCWRTYVWQPSPRGTESTESKPKQKWYSCPNVCWVVEWNAVVAQYRAPICLVFSEENKKFLGDGVCSVRSQIDGNINDQRMREMKQTECTRFQFFDLPNGNFVFCKRSASCAFDLLLSQEKMHRFSCIRHTRSTVAVTAERSHHNSHTKNRFKSWFHQRDLSALLVSASNIQRCASSDWSNCCLMMPCCARCTQIIMRTIFAEAVGEPAPHSIPMHPSVVMCSAFYAAAAATIIITIRLASHHPRSDDASARVMIMRIFVSRIIITFIPRLPVRLRVNVLRIHCLEKKWKSKTQFSLSRWKWNLQLFAVCCFDSIKILFFCGINCVRGCALRTAQRFTLFLLLTRHW